MGQVISKNLFLQTSLETWQKLNKSSKNRQKQKMCYLFLRNLLGPFLNTLTQILLKNVNVIDKCQSYWQIKDERWKIIQNKVNVAWAMCPVDNFISNILLPLLFESKYSRTNQIKLVEDSLYKFLSIPFLNTLFKLSLIWMGGGHGVMISLQELSCIS